VQRIRDEKKFSSVDTLIAQTRDDVACAENIFRGLNLAAES